MKGVVRPQQAPTAKKLSTHRQIGGEAGATVTGPSGSIGEVDMVVYRADREYLGLSLHVYEMPCSSLPETEAEPCGWEVGVARYRVGGQ